MGIRDVLSAEGAGLLEVHHDEVVLHALDDLPQPPHHLLIHTATAVPLPLQASQLLLFHLVFGTFGKLIALQTPLNSCYFTRFLELFGNYLPVRRHSLRC